MEQAQPGDCMHPNAASLHPPVTAPSHPTPTQAHFDSDNMPPKVVQGYKFNIFYPDLIDKSSAPTYVLERDPESADGSTCMIRFKAGAPYEDIAFRIVNKEWEYTAKRGFKCVFERGILHLYFNFKRTGYRR